MIGSCQGRSIILVVEDDIAIMEIIVTALEQSGYPVVGKSDPLDAIQVAADTGNQILLLITDVSMPVLSGPDLVASIRGARPELPFPVLYTSGNDRQVLEKNYGIRTDANAFIQKPFRIAALIRKVEDVLAGTLT